jgi:hypothetical protein
MAEAPPSWEGLPPCSPRCASPVPLGLDCGATAELPPSGARGARGARGPSHGKPGPLRLGSQTPASFAFLALFRASCHELKARSAERKCAAKSPGAAPGSLRRWIAGGRRRGRRVPAVQRSGGIGREIESAAPSGARTALDSR